MVHKPAALGRNMARVACRRLASRWFACSFEGLACDGIDFAPTNVAFIQGRDGVIACDTYLGPESMATAVAEAIKLGLDASLPFTVFNTHGDFDHHWGNCYFAGARIVGHELARQAIERDGPADLDKHGSLATGAVTLVPPAITFTERLELAGGEIVLFHAPGHTPDSSACHDRIDKILFAGDDVEDPVPWITSPDLDPFIETLEGFLELDVEVVIPGHGPAVSGPGLIEANLRYLRALARGEDAGPLARGNPAVHAHNLDVLGRR